MKKQRHAKIKELISDYIIETQEDLLKYLRKDGFDVTQATVSRDIKELRLIKTLDSGEVYRYMMPRADRGTAKINYTDIFTGAVISVEYAMNDVVVKCHSGTASAVAAAIDHMNWNTVLGTIAGDDTILVITRSENQAQELTRELSNLTENN